MLHSTIKTAKMRKKLILRHTQTGSKQAIETVSTHTKLSSVINKQSLQ